MRKATGIVLAMLGFAGWAFWKARAESNTTDISYEKFTPMEEKNSPISNEEVKEFVEKNFKFFDLSSLRENTKKARKERNWYKRFPKGIWCILEKPFYKALYCAMLIRGRPYEVVVPLGRDPMIVKYYKYEEAQGKGCNKADVCINETGTLEHFEFACPTKFLPPKAVEEFNRIPLSKKEL